MSGEHGFSGLLAERDALRARVTTLEEAIIAIRERCHSETRQGLLAICDLALARKDQS